MDEILDMASKIPLPIISPTITGSATIEPPPVTSTLSASLASIPTSTSLPGHPIPHRVFEHATKAGYITLWVIFATFIIITLIFTLMTIRIEKHLRLFHYITILVSLITGLSYFTMAAGSGYSYHLVNVIYHDKHATELTFRQIYWARYIDWAITMPLILLDLTILAGLPGVEILLAIFAAITMMLFGLLAAFSYTAVQWGYFTISCMFYLYILFTLVLSCHAAMARNARVGKLFTAMSLYIIVVWTLYPIVWALGEGTQRISVNTEIFLFAILDILAKGVFGGWLLLAHLRIQESHVPITGWWIIGVGVVEGTRDESRRLFDDD